MKDYRLYSLKEEITASTAPVVLFGAGSYAGIAHFAMEQHGIPVAYFCDSDPKKHGKSCFDTPIISAAALAQIDLGAHIFISSNYIDPISSELAAHGFTNIYDCAALFDNTDFTKADVRNYSKNNISMSLAEVYRKITTHRNMRHSVSRRPGIQIRLIDVVVTEACTMRCKDCANLMQYYAKPKNSDVDLLLQAFDKIAQSVGGFSEVRLLGGEPFLNKQIHAVIDKIAAYDHVEKIAIFTNATVVPKEANLTSLQNKKVFLDITNYGQLSRNHDKLIATLEANNIAYVTHVPQPWTDSAKIEFHKRELAQTAELFSKCCVNDIMTLLNGKLYRCPFSAHATNLKAIPSVKDEIIDLSDEAGVAQETIKTEIEDLYTNRPYIFACSYCNGRDYSTPSVEPGVQTKTVLPLARTFETPNA